jgi:hypothetical protein
MELDTVSRIATFQTRSGDAVARLYGEVLATYAPADRILRWSWAGRSSSAAATHGDVVFREGQARGIPQLTMSVVGDLELDDAKALVELGALVARADAVHERMANGEIELLGLFDRPRPSENVELARESRFSVPPPPVVEKAERITDTKAPPPRAYRSIPPIREVYEPRTGSSPPRAAASSSKPPAVASASRPPPPVSPAAPSPFPGASSPPSAVAKKLREPSRALFLPVANAVLAALGRGSKGYLQGLFVLTLDHRALGPKADESEKRRVLVQLVVVDAAGILRALDPPIEVVEAALAMVEADRREGNGEWRKLSARITPKSDGGATLNVDVI